MLCADLVDNCTMQHANQTAQSILDVYHLLHSNLPNTHILSLAILPKGETWPNRCSDAILSVNTELQVCPNLFTSYKALQPACAQASRMACKRSQATTAISAM